MTAEKQVRVLVIDDSEVMRRSLRQVLNAFNDLQWVGKSSDSHDTFDLCQTLYPDVILLDIGLSHVDVPKLISSIKVHHPHPKIIGITSFEDPFIINHILQAGAVLCLSKNTNVAQIAESVRQVACVAN